MSSNYVLLRVLRQSTLLKLIMQHRKIAAALFLRNSFGKEVSCRQEPYGSHDTGTQRSFNCECGNPRRIYTRSRQPFVSELASLSILAELSRNEHNSAQLSRTQPNSAELAEFKKNSLKSVIAQKVHRGGGHG